MSEKVWDKWERGLLIQLSIIPGARGVPLAYVVREKEMSNNEYYSIKLSSSNIDELTLARCPHHGTAFAADNRQVFQIISALTNGEPSYEWVKPFAAQADGKSAMAAEGLRETLHYKNERSFPFHRFTNQCKEMFNTFSKTNDSMTEAAKLPFLLERVQHPSLLHTVAAMKVRMEDYDFEKAANLVAAEVAKLNKSGGFSTRNVSAIGTDPLAKVRGKDGKIKTGWIDNFHSLPEEAKQAVIEKLLTTLELLGIPR